MLRSTLRRCTSIVLLVTLALPAFAAPPEPPLAAPWKLLLAPYLMGNSDEGIVGGIGFGASQAEQVYLLLAGEASTKGAYRLAAKGEVQRGATRYVGKAVVGRNFTELYPSSGHNPDPYARGYLRGFEFRLSALYPLSSHLQAGPELNLRKSDGVNPEDPNGDPIPRELLPRFRDAFNSLAGLHVRWRTTNPVRPVDGSLIEAHLLGGVATSQPWSAQRTDAEAQLFAARATPLTPTLRLYLRADLRAQLETPPPLRNFVGGDDFVRGTARARDVGRRTVAGRSELHWTFYRNVRWPMQLMHWFVPFVPVYGLDWEAVPFYDIGAAGDPDTGWARTRQGAGIGLRVVLPPDLVARIDIARSFDGGMGFYFGIGESL